MKFVGKFSVLSGIISVIVGIGLLENEGMLLVLAFLLVGIGVLTQFLGYRIYVAGQHEEVIKARREELRRNNFIEVWKYCKVR